MFKLLLFFLQTMHKKTELKYIFKKLYKKKEIRQG